MGTFLIILLLAMFFGAKPFFRARARGSFNPRVMMVTTHLGLGGLERMILNLSRDLKDWTPVIFVYEDYDRYLGSALHPEFEAAGIEIISLDKSPGFSSLVVLRLAYEIFRRRISLVHSHDLGALTYAVFAKWVCFGGIPIVNTQHSFVHLKKKESYEYLEKFFSLFIAKKVAVSEALKEQYETIGISSANIAVIPNGVEFPAGPVVGKADRLSKRDVVLKEIKDPAARELLTRRRDTVWALCMARVHPGKGQPHVLDLWKGLSESACKTATLIYVGAEPVQGAVSELKKKIETIIRTDDIVYAGFTHQPATWITSSEIFLSGSEFEGMPLGPIEAVGAGLEVLVSDIPGHSMLPGFVERFSFEDKAAGSKKLELIIQKASLLQDNQAGWTRGQDFRNNFGIPAMAGAYEAIYNKVIAR